MAGILLKMCIAIPHPKPILTRRYAHEHPAKNGTAINKNEYGKIMLLKASRWTKPKAIAVT